MRLRRRRGANAVEFALIAGPLFIIILGTMEYSWFLFHQIMLDSAVREGARVASRTPDAEREQAGFDAANDFWANHGMAGTLTLDFDDTFPISAGGAVQLIVLEGQFPYARLLNGVVPVPTTVFANAAVRDEVNTTPP